MVVYGVLLLLPSCVKSDTLKLTKIITDRILLLLLLLPFNRFDSEFLHQTKAEVVGVVLIAFNGKKISSQTRNYL